MYSYVTILYTYMFTKEVNIKQITDAGNYKAE